MVSSIANGPLGVRRTSSTNAQLGKLYSSLFGARFKRCPTSCPGPQAKTTIILSTSLLTPITSARARFQWQQPDTVNWNCQIQTASRAAKRPVNSSASKGTVKMCKPAKIQTRSNNAPKLPTIVPTETSQRRQIVLSLLLCYRLCYLMLKTTQFRGGEVVSVWFASPLTLYVRLYGRDSILLLNIRVMCYCTSIRFAA